MHQTLTPRTNGTACYKIVTSWTTKNKAHDLARQINGHCVVESGTGIQFDYSEAERILGSVQQTEKVCVLRGFLKSDEVGSRGGQPLGFQQQIVEVTIAAHATQ
jgi:hypothetical protein